MPANLLLLLAAAIWGFGFVAQTLGMEHLSPFAFNGLRFLIGTLSLVPLVWFLHRQHKIHVSTAKEFAIGSGVVGLLLFAGASFQQVGLLYTTAANAGFITGLYIVLVPILGLALKHTTGANTWVGCAIAALGLYFLSVKEGMTIGYGDALQLVGALFWALHILAVDHFAKRISPVLLAMMQFLVCGVLSLMVSAVIEVTTLDGVLAAWGSLAYAGLISVGIAYTLQVLAQKHAHPAHAAIILSLETVFAAIGGILFLGESLGIRALFGCALMLLGMLISQVPLRYLVKSRHEKLS
ncbi:DMT family transporter [Shewanella sp. CG12_big_fil_rev_8_21_14_0_65_47_15]|uniref:DMT family transporter n=1 Tax=Shewanella sp. CG12_big_fil_rev_8_21_14_0_65_47_15 TaxID=1975537 RepID=UPI000CC09F8C|nr:DMT family transporter [Shewanella sp. CG12_big_fil_rev_8_21_14_0_65_47_15]PIW62322.1 MAG: EamA family transporter [Shewanella sp. CG12_big_fil_rev_8_21_14_0_65_47_15]